MAPLLGRARADPAFDESNPPGSLTGGPNNVLPSRVAGSEEQPRSLARFLPCACRVPSILRVGKPGSVNVPGGYT